MNNYSVYIHTCPNGKKYIGITSKVPEYRWANGNNYRHNIHFYRAIKKYGWDKIKHEIIYANLTEQEASVIEINLIKKYNTMNSKYGFNKTSGGEIGKDVSEETKILMSKNRKNIYCGEEHYCHGKHPSEIFGEQAWLKNVDLAKKRWVGDNNPNRVNPKFNEDHHNYGRKWSDEVVERMRKGRSIHFVLDDEKAGEILKLYFEYNLTQKEISKKFNIARQTVSDVVTRKIYRHIDYDYNHSEALIVKEKRRVDKISRPIAMIDENGKIIKEAKSITDMCDLIGWSSSGILKHLKNRVQHPIFIYL